jgi:hypothetical protein
MHWTEHPPAECDRGAVLAEIEQASGRSLSASDSLPDELIATVQALEREGCNLSCLLTWIYSDHPEAWSAPAFARWFRAWTVAKANFKELQREALQ